MHAFALSSSPPPEPMPQPLRSISIAGYKSIRDATVELRPLNVLIGANGSGKSNFISAFAFLHDLVAQRLALHVGVRGGADALLHFGRKQTRALGFKLDFDPAGYEVALQPTPSGGLVLADEVCWLRGADQAAPYREHLNSTGRFESLLRDQAGAADHVRVSIESWRVFHFHDTSATAYVKQKHQIGDNAFLRADASNLGAYLYRLKHTAATSYQQIVGTLRFIAPGFDDFVLEPDIFNKDYIQLQWRAKGSDELFTAHTLSDGTLRFVCLATLLLQPHLPTTVLIDEPELGLHPAALQTLAAMLESASVRAQIIVSTQSVTLVDQLAAEDIIVVDHDGESSSFHRIAQDKIAPWTDRYSIGEIWEKNLIGGRP